MPGGDPSGRLPEPGESARPDIGEVVRGVAHDLANLITIISGNAEELERRDGLDDRSVVAVAGIEAAAQSAAGLIRRLQYAAAGRAVPVQRVGLNVLVRRSEPLIRAVAGPNVRVGFAIDEAVGEVVADELDVQRALLNLARNAVDAMSSGGSMVVATGRDEHGMARLSVSDTGPGIDPHVAGVAIGSGSSTKQGEFHGIGLGEVLAIAERHGGSIAIDSAPGRGTRVDLSLPEAAPERV